MSWITVIVALACVLAGAGLAAALGRWRRLDRARVVLVGVGAFALLLGGAQMLITPLLQARYDASRVDESLSSNAAFAAIKKHDPETYARIMSELRTGLLNGRSKAELIDLARNEVSGLVQKRLPRASNEAASEYMRVMVQEMTELRRHGGELCHSFLFPKPGVALDLNRYISVNTRDADFAALSQVVRSSTLAPQAVPQQAEVASRLKPVVTALAGRYGDDLRLLQEPDKPGVDRDKLCSINIDMYTVILQLPASDSGPLIRYLMGQ